MYLWAGRLRSGPSYLDIDIQCFNYTSRILLRQMEPLPSS